MEIELIFFSLLLVLNSMNCVLRCKPSPIVRRVLTMVGSSRSSMIAAVVLLLLSALSEVVSSAGFNADAAFCGDHTASDTGGGSFPLALSVSCRQLL